MCGDKTMQQTKQSFFSKAGVILLAVFAFFIFIGKFALYGVEGTPKPSVDKKVHQVRIVGENLSADYAVLQLSTRKEPAYDVQNQQSFIKSDMQANVSFSSSFSPVAVFLLRPFQQLPYLNFVQQWLLTGVFFYSLALYLFLPLKKVLFFLFASPALTLSAVSGGWGLYLAFAVVFVLYIKPERFAVTAFFYGLTVCSFPTFLVLGALLAWRKQYKSLVCGGVFAVFLAIMAISNVSFPVFKEAVKAAFLMPTQNPCAYASFYTMFLCNGASVYVAGAVWGAVVSLLIYYGVKIARIRGDDALLNAYVCASLPILFIGALPSAFALTCVSCIILWHFYGRTDSSEEFKTALVASFILPFFDTLFVQKTGFSLLPFISAFWARFCVQKSLLV